MNNDKAYYRLLNQEPDEGRSRKQWLAILLLIAVASITIRILIEYHFDHSALLYVGVPFALSLAIAALRPPRSKEKWWHAYRDQILTALIVFLGSSIVLFEGFVCVLFFMPIYFLTVTAGFFISWFLHSRKQRKGTTFVSILPLLVLVSALEGTSDHLSMSRVTQVTVTKVVDLSPTEIIKNLSKPINLQKKRGWLLAVFPMPYHIEAEALASGAIHRVYTRYSRWFFTNTHEGELHLKIIAVEPTRVTTQVIHDSTFFASYVNTIGTQITFVEVAPHRTEISLRINYERKLDPAWYFHPLQQFGMGQMAEFLIDEVMIRE